jgi:hypothetical protein
LQIRRSKIKKALPIILAIIIALVAAYFGASRFEQEVTGQKEMATIIVASRSIAPYTILDQENLKKIRVPKDRIDPDAVNKPDELLGKITIAKILPDEQIRKEKISGDLNIKDKEIIAINVDMTRACAGWIQSGDIVDVWHLNEGANNTLIASNATVLDLRNSSGESIFAGTTEVLASIASSITPSSPPSIAILVVEAKFTPRVINAAKSQNAVLVKKFASTERLYTPTDAKPETLKDITGAEKGEESLQNVKNMFDF